MAKTLLQGVNAVLIQLGYIKGNSGELASLTDSQRQTTIDQTIQAWNRLLVEVYDASDKPLPTELAENTITLVTSDRDYALQTDLVQLRWPFTEQTRGLQIWEYNGGYEQIFKDQVQPANYTGQASFAAIRSTDGELYLNAIPTSGENGDVYTYQYDKEITVALAADTFPFTDTVFETLISACSELVSRYKKRSFDAGEYNKALGLAVGLMTKGQQRTSWTPERGSGFNITDPLEAVDATISTSG